MMQLAPSRCQQEENSKAYGEGVTPAEILGSGVKPVSAPPAFGDLYDKINEASQGSLA